MTATGCERRPATAVALRIRLVVLACLTVAFALRLYRIATPSLSYDEAVSVYLARMPLGDMLRWTATDVQPPLYYLLLRGWVLIVGQSEFSLRFLSLAFSLASVALVYALGRSVLGATAGALACLVATLHPWYIWHAQDARMYSLLLALCLVSTYLLLRWQRNTRQADGRPGVALAASSLAALYTHYLAAPLLVYHFLLVGARAWREHRLRPIRRYVAGVVLPVALLYGPWLPAVLSTYRRDTSYWQGPAKLGEILRKCLTAMFVGGAGETVLEQAGLRLAIALAVVLLVLTALAWARWSRQPELPQAQVLLLGMVLFPAGITLALVSVIPKFNVRYLMPASMALPLLWGAALDGAWQRRSTLSRAAAVSGLLAACLGSIYALRAMYWDARLTRADFRAAVTTVTHQMRLDEVVLLCSGHMYPIWQYYAPGVAYVPLPPMRVLAVDQRLNLDVGRTLDLSLKGKRGAWLLLWQDGVADPMGAAQFLLDQAGPASEQGFWQVRLRHYRFQSPPAWPDTPLPQQTIGANFGGQVTLLGVSRLAPNQIALFWRAERQLDVTYRAQLSLRDAANHEVARLHFAPAGDLYPTNAWRPGETTFTRLSLTLPPAQPSGSYSLVIGLYRSDTATPLDILDEAGNPQGQTIEPVRLDLPGTTASVDAQVARASYGLQRQSVAWNGLELLGSGACPLGDLPPGAHLSVPLLWRSGVSLAGAGIEARGASQGLPGGYTTLVVSANHLPAQLAPDQTLLAWLDTYVPAGAPPGVMVVEVRPTGADPTAPGAAAGSDAWADLCRIAVREIARSYAVPTLRWPSHARLGDDIALLGVDPGPVSSLTAASRTLTITVAWQAVRTPAANYVEFVHLLGPDGRVWGQWSGEPVAGQRPTAGWLPAEVVSDRITIQVPSDAPPGIYRVEVGMLDGSAKGTHRLPVTENGASVPDSAVELGELSLVR